MNTQHVSRVGIVAKLRLPTAAPHLTETVAWLDERGIEPVVETETAALAGFGPDRRRAPRDELPCLVDLLLVLGGDGTLLGMAHRVAQCGRDIPILGVNYGSLGFLTEIRINELYPSLESVLKGEASFDERLLLQAAAHFAREVGPVLYASGEESEQQIQSRGDRLGVVAPPLYLLSETCIERILEEIARELGTENG